MKSFYEMNESEKPLFVDFFAIWCGPCRVMSPVVDRLERKYGEKMNFLKIDVDKNEELSFKTNTAVSQ